MFVTWPCPLPDGTVGEESALAYDRARHARVLVLPALFDEHNKTRHLTTEIMRQLDAFGIDSVLPDLAGCNESRAPLPDQTLIAWRAAASAAATHFSATHVFAIRAGAWLAPANLPGWLYSPAKPAQTLRAMLRARTIAAREAGLEENSADLLATAREEGIELAGWQLGGAMIRELEASEFKPHATHQVIEQAEVGGSPLWLRAEPDFVPSQAEALAEILRSGIAPA